MAKQFPRAAGAAWYEIKALAGDAGRSVTHIWIYDVIGDDWYAPSLTAQALCQEIAAIETEEIVLHFASPGGSCSDGIAIYNALVAHPAKVSSIIEGWTGSIATILALAADPGCISMFDNCFFMIHKAWGITVGDEDEIRKYADFLGAITQTMVNIYMTRCTKTADELVAALSEQTNLTAEQALEWGFVDEVTTGMQAAALAHPQVIDTNVLQALGFTTLPDALPALPGFQPAGVGRALSAENETKLVDARDLIEEVLASIDGASARITEEPPAAETGDSGSTVEPGRLAALLARTRLT
jgi:ATP-dependent Clp protease, protease subunit